MTEILAVAAFFIAFGTVFLVNDAMRKTERKNDAQIKSFIDKHGADLDQNNALIKETREAMATLAAAAKKDREEFSEVKKRLDQLEENLSGVKDDLDSLDDSLKPQARKYPRKSA